ncbi:MAG: Na-translocating system protein MpsB [Deltaproteobacteria bacterium]|nr:Na-translocating system protein MpsB [Deltaproteobacteria bacterium]
MSSHASVHGEAQLATLLEEVRTLLPRQAPLGDFLHRNVLEALEDRPFHDAIEDARVRLGFDGYLPLSAYRALLHDGTITARAFSDALAEYDLRRGDTWSAPLDARTVERLALAHELGPASLAECEFLRTETDWTRRAFAGCSHDAVGAMVADTNRWISMQSSDKDHRECDESRVVAMLFEALGSMLDRAASGDDAPESLVGTAREKYAHTHALDPWVAVDQFLIRILAAYLDESVASWTIPGGNDGFRAVVVAQLSTGKLLRDRWEEAARETLKSASRDSAHKLIAEELARWAVPAREWRTTIERSVLPLRGWAGMVSVLEQDPTHQGRQRKVSLAEFVAVRLVLDRAMGEQLKQQEREASQGACAREKRAMDHWRLFRLMQLGGVGLGQLYRAGSAGISATIVLLDRFDEPTRRRVFHDAMERSHVWRMLNAMTDVAQHHDAAQPRRERPRFQAMFCLDDREESIRRHFEEQSELHETFGVAGFFGIPMAYESLDDSRVAAHCPPVLSPTQHVRESATESDMGVHLRRQRSLSLAARTQRGMDHGSRSLLRGLALLPITGVFAAARLVLQTHFPSLFANGTHLISRWLVPVPRTRLAVNAIPNPTRATDTAADHDESVEHSAKRVHDALEAAGLTHSFARLVILLGHRASMVNNPHAAAYQCAACAGRSGGPNARAFALLANDPEVRAALARRGLMIPEDTWFLGGCHNTTTDGVTLDDLDQLPDTHTLELKSLQKCLEIARARSALERIRYFEHAPKTRSPARALAHVEERSVDLSQARPELGHSNNALAVIGRRSVTRGLFLDRRAFLLSYDASVDPEGDVLERSMAAAVPVGASINLDYYFSRVDPQSWGSGSKLPHNLVALLGVQEGASGDLRVALPTQMTEQHEPQRLLVVVEASVDAVRRVLSRQAYVRALVAHGWVRLAVLDPHTKQFSLWHGDELVPWTDEIESLPTVQSSEEHHQHRTVSLAPVRVVSRPSPRVTAA